MKVLLISMPFSPFNPSSQLAVLKGHLDARAVPGRTVQTAHLFVHLARRVGLAGWEQLSNETAGTKVGNLLFQRLLLDRQECSALELLGPEPVRDLADGAGIGPELIGRWQEAVAAFWEDLLAGRPVELDGHDVYGFSTVYNQLFPSLALARELKRRNPCATIVFGGAEVHGACGASVLRRFPFVDAIVQGRGERPLDELLDVLERGSGVDGLASVAGVATRTAEGAVIGPRPRPPQEKPLFGLPDFAEFFDTLAQAGFPPEACTGIPLEASQGCYWRRCTFCGSREMFSCYRVKSRQQIRQEVERAVERHAVYHVIFTDEALPAGNVGAALAPLAGEDWARHLALLAQIRAGFGKAQLAALAGHGLRVAQVGIESFSSEVLRRMDKGTTALQNVRCLKWCRELGIAVDYNLILGYPHAPRGEGERQARMFPLLWHLDPPQPSDFYVHRFSLLSDPAALPAGYTLRPAPHYNTDIFPEGLAGLELIAHEPVPPDGSPAPGDEALRAGMALWRRRHRPGLLHFFHGKGFLLLADARTATPRTLRLEGLARELYLFCDDIRTPEALRERFGRQVDEALRLVEALERSGLLLRDGEEMIALAPAYPGRVGWTG